MAEHEIYDISWSRRGWQARCNCGVELPQRRYQAVANRDGIEHLVGARIAAYRARYTSNVRFVRAVRADGELAALLALMDETRAA